MAATTASSPASSASQRCQARTRPEYSTGTARASTSWGPSRSRVRYVEARPVRCRSRKSSRLACTPAPTTREAWDSEASISAASSGSGAGLEAQRPDVEPLQGIQRGGAVAAVDDHDHVAGAAQHLGRDQVLARGAAS